MSWRGVYREETFDEVVGDFLKIAREQRKLTIEDVAAATGISGRRIRQIESGRVHVTVYQAKLIADQVGFSLALLFQSGPNIIPCSLLDGQYLIKLINRVAEKLGQAE